MKLILTQRSPLCLLFILSGTLFVFFNIDDSPFPRVNNNNIADLDVFIQTLKKSFPNLMYLSMLKNPACPELIAEDHKRYRSELYRFSVFGPSAGAMS